MADPIVETRLRVTGIRTDTEVKRGLQALYDVFTPLGLGGATFEVTDAGTWVIIKHQRSVTPDVAAIDAALAAAGPFGIERTRATRVPRYTGCMANLTIAVDDDLLRRARIRALEQGTSVNALLRAHLEAFADSGAEAVLRRQVAALARASTASSGESGRSWTRDDLHDRSA